MENRDQTGPFGISIRYIRWATTLSTMALEVAVLVVLGYWGDRRWGTAPWLMMAGAGLGLFGFAWQVYRLLQETSQEAVKETRRAKPQRNKSP